MEAHPLWERGVAGSSPATPMPESEITARGGAKRWRTVKLPGGKYIKVAIVPRAGPRGGHTVAGPPRYREDYTAPAKRVRVRKVTRGRMRLRKRAGRT